MSDRVERAASDEPGIEECRSVASDPDEGYDAELDGDGGHDWSTGNADVP